MVSVCSSSSFLINHFEPVLSCRRCAAGRGRGRIYSTWRAQSVSYPLSRSLHSCLVEQLKLSCHAAGAQQAEDEDDFLDLEGEEEGEEAARPPLRAVAAGSQFPHLPGPASFLVSPLCMAYFPNICIPCVAQSMPADASPDLPSAQGSRGMCASLMPLTAAARPAMAVFPQPAECGRAGVVLGRRGAARVGAQLHAQQHLHLLQRRLHPRGEALAS